MTVCFGHCGVSRPFSVIIVVKLKATSRTGLPMSEVHNAEWQRLEQRMMYHQAATEELSELWLADRLAEQARTPMPSPYGSILVRYANNEQNVLRG